MRLGEKPNEKEGRMPIGRDSCFRCVFSEKIAENNGSGEKGREDERRRIGKYPGICGVIREKGRRGKRESDPGRADRKPGPRAGSGGRNSASASDRENDAERREKDREQNFGNEAVLPAEGYPLDIQRAARSRGED